MIITIIISIQGSLKDYITQTTVVWGLFNVLMQYLTVLQTHIFRFMNDTFCAHMLPVKRCPLFGWKWSFSHHCNALRHIKEMDCSVPAALRGPWGDHPLGRVCPTSLHPSEATQRHWAPVGCCRMSAGTIPEVLKDYMSPPCFKGFGLVLLSDMDATGGSLSAPYSF